MSHTPVLLKEMIDALAPKDGEIYVDGTFGGGGYTRAILAAAQCQVIGLDRDPDAVARGKALELEFPGRFKILQGTFSELKDLLSSINIIKVNGFVFDLGVSSFQIDEPERGFSFRFEGPLDMRMSSEGLSAADVVNTYDEKEIADIIYRYGEEKKSRSIARQIVAARREAPFETTSQLANLVKSVVRGSKEGQHPATQTFQALRIFVNNELIEVSKVLEIAQNCLVPGGRLVVVTFHSLEDRLVKQFLRDCEGRVAAGSRYQPDVGNLNRPATFKVMHGKGISPSEQEMRENPRARSARLRCAIKLEAV